MPGKALTPEQASEALILREAGYTLMTVAERLNISVSTLQRLYSKNAVLKGSATQMVLNAARTELLNKLIADRVKEEAASIIADNLAHTRILREKMGAAIEQLNATNVTEAALVMRAAAAYSTALKNTSDMLRLSLRFDEAIEPQMEETLPELIIRELTAEEIVAERAKHEKDEEAA